jgi:hypothetical protein
VRWVGRHWANLRWRPAVRAGSTLTSSLQVACSCAPLMPKAAARSSTRPSTKAAPASSLQDKPGLCLTEGRQWQPLEAIAPLCQCNAPHRSASTHATRTGLSSCLAGSWMLARPLRMPCSPPAPLLRVLTVCTVRSPGSQRLCWWWPLQVTAVVPACSALSWHSLALPQIHRAEYPSNGASYGKCQTDH